MTVSEKTTTTDNKIEENKAQYDLDDKLRRFQFYHQEEQVKLNFGQQDVLPEEELLQKAATIKRFEYSPLGIQLKIQTDIVKKKKQYERLDKVYKFNETIIKNDRKPTVRKYNKSNLIHNSNMVFTNIVLLKNLATFFLNQTILFWPTCLMIQINLAS